LIGNPKSNNNPMETMVLNDKSVTPNDEIVFSIIGDKRLLWQKIMNYLHDNHTDVTEVWKYYNDGKSWLFRTLKKGKTIFWIRVLEDTFRVAFYFGDKAEPMIEQSSLPESIKNDFRNAKRFNTTRGIAIGMADDADASNAIKLIELRLKLK
jgi:hypothetical protein